MMSSNFDVREHRIPATHIREYPRATADGDADVLHLAVKQYTPTKTYKARKEITIIGAHANGFPKVCAAGFRALRLHLIRLTGAVRTAVGRTV